MGKLDWLLDSFSYFVGFACHMYVAANMSVSKQSSKQHLAYTRIPTVQTRGTDLSWSDGLFTVQWHIYSWSKSRLTQLTVSPCLGHESKRDQSTEAHQRTDRSTHHGQIAYWWQGRIGCWSAACHVKHDTIVSLSSTRSRTLTSASLTFYLSPERECLQESGTSKEAGHPTHERSHWSRNTIGAERRFRASGPLKRSSPPNRRAVSCTLLGHCKLSSHKPWTSRP